MTNEEAIEYNKNLKMYMKISDKQAPCKFLEENYIALDMAIEALQENESLAKTVIEASELLRKQRPHGEWIRKEDVIELICKVNDHFGYTDSMHLFNELFERNCGALMISLNSKIEDPCTKYIGNMCEHVCEKRYKYLKIGNTIYTQDDDKQGWIGREGE